MVLSKPRWLVVGTCKKSSLMDVGISNPKSITL
jgi:hypothetical protein